MAIESSPVAAGDEVLADQYNKLRKDVLINHDHTEDQGGEVGHGDLIETGAMAGMYHTHANVRKHMMGSDETFEDNPGGNYGVHGLPASVSPMGFIGHVTEQEPEAGQASTPNLSAAQWSMITGTFVPQSKKAWVHFGMSFDSAPIVQAIPIEPYPKDSICTTCHVGIVEQSRFEIFLHYMNDAISWFAVGPYSG